MGVSVGVGVSVGGPTVSVIGGGPGCVSVGVSVGPPGVTVMGVDSVAVTTSVGGLQVK